MPSIVIRPSGNDDLSPSEITPERIYLERRHFLKEIAGAITATASPLVLANSVCTQLAAPPSLLKGEVPNKWDDITHYNNFYEFSPEKTAIATLAENMVISPWSIRIEGECEKPTTYAIEDLRKKFPLEERIYRLRCVEGWSMVIPWDGFQLCKLLQEVRPTSKAKYVRFISLQDTKRLYGQRTNVLPWPYTEGLRIDEAMHPLTIMAMGIYGKPIPNQNGAPIRLVTPWKYGFKSIKSIVTIRLEEAQPQSSWSQASSEYGFYANVNPEVPHPRWTQSREQRIGELRKRKTLPFNGYAELVASLYKDMDLAKYF